MKSRILILLLTACASIGFCGCASSLHFDRRASAPAFDGGREPVYVTNPELTQELAILRGSQIYALSDRPDGVRRLTLHPIRQYGRCANPLMLTIFTFGLVPGYLPGAVVFEYELDTSAGAQVYSHNLPVYERFSVWENLHRGDRTEVLSEALKHSQRIERQPNQALQTTPMTCTGSEKTIVFGRPQRGV